MEQAGGRQDQIEVSSKQRVDLLLVERGLADSRSLARRLVMSGQVWADDQLVHKPSETLAPEARLEVRGGPRYVSRGGDKLAAALDEFQIEPAGWTCADVGSSTGGFTDCLLQHGAAKVYAIDVGYGVLHWKLRNDARVVSMERTNARYLQQLPEPVRLVTIDVAFISLALILPRAVEWLQPEGEIVALVKPQFEAGPDHVAKGGVVRDPVVHRQVLERVLAQAERVGLWPRGLCRSPLIGPKGNIEFLAWLRPVPTPNSPGAERLITAVLASGPGEPG